MTVNHLSYSGLLLVHKDRWWGVGRGYAGLDRKKGDLDSHIVLSACTDISQAVALFPPSVKVCTLLL